LIEVEHIHRRYCLYRRVVKTLCSKTYRGHCGMCRPRPSSMYKQLAACFKVGLLIPGEIAFPGRESQFPGLVRDSRFRPSTYLWRNRSWIVGGTQGGGRCRTPLPPADDHTTGGGVLETLQNAPPPSEAARQLVVVAGARQMGSFNGGQQSGLRYRGACVEMRAGNATEGGVTIVNRTPGMGDQRPAAYAAGRSANISSLVNMPS